MQCFNQRLSLLTAVVLLLSLILMTGCVPAGTTTGAPQAETTQTDPTPTQTPQDTAPVRITALKGPTGIGLVKLMQDQEQGNSQQPYQIELVASPDEIVAQIGSGQTDIAALPTNLAPILYQKTDAGIRLLAVNTLGVLHILSQDESIQKLEDLAGRELLATGQGSVPEYALNDLLQQAGILDQVTVTYLSEHAELATRAVSGDADLVMLPEPFVTTVLNKNTNLRLALDLTEEWQRFHTGTSGSELAMGCMVVSQAFLTERPEAVQRFLAEYEASVVFVRNNPQEAGQWVADYEIMPDAGLAAQAIPNCHLVLIQGQAMQEALDPFYALLFAANPQAIGGALPPDQLYYLP